MCSVNTKVSSASRAYRSASPGSRWSVCRRDCVHQSFALVSGSAAVSRLRERALEQLLGSSERPVVHQRVGEQDGEADGLEQVLLLLRILVPAFEHRERPSS